MNDKKRHALITGASRGIGAAIALELAKAGHSISVNYNSHSNDAERVVKDLLNIGVDAKAVKGNVSDKKSVTRWTTPPVVPLPTFNDSEPTVADTLAAALANCPPSVAALVRIVEFLVAIVLVTPIHYLVDKINYIHYNRV